MNHYYPAHLYPHVTEYAEHPTNAEVLAFTNTQRARAVENYASHKRFLFVYLIKPLNALNARQFDTELEGYDKRLHSGAPHNVPYGPDELEVVAVAEL